jgi:flagellar hook protein FlgE
MMRSLFSGVSGLRNHQTRMDVIGNNVANANTLGFKSSRVTFQEGYAQLLQSAGRPQGGMGGTNPQQVGTGMRIGSIDTLFGQGSFETTGQVTDLAIQGDAFFTVSDGTGRNYTRAGNFRLDADGRLVMPATGHVLQGRMATNGVFGGSVTDIRLPFGQKAPAQATDKAMLGGNLDSAAPVFAGDINDRADRENPANRGAFAETSITVYDSLGSKHELKIEMWKTDTNEWQWQLDPSGLAALPSPPPAGGGTFTFSDEGLLTSSGGQISFAPAGGAGPVTVEIDPGSGIRGLTQFASRSTAVLREQNGYPMGTLADFGIDQAGIITGTFDNGVNMVLGQIALADFNNPGGLVKVGANMYGVSPNSGEPQIGFAGEGSTSTIASSALEMSNVDLAQEFTQMIIAQRGFSASSRVISSADDMLQEVVNLKR